MFAAKFVLFVALSLSVSNFYFKASGDDPSGEVMPSPTGCVNCSKCETPCQQQQPPSISGYPSYGAPPPPPPSGYSIYGAPPPPPREAGQSKCPPAGGVQCCTPPAPYTYANSPPNPYTYVPYGEGEGSASTLVPILVPLMMLSSSFIFLS